MGEEGRETDRVRRPDNNRNRRRMKRKATKEADGTLSVAYANIQGGLKSKMPEINIETSKFKADIVALSETHGDETKKRMPKMEGFTPFHADRKTGNHWGGVAVYVRDELNPYKLDQVEHEENLDEVIWVGISQGNCNTAICVVYIAPGEPIDTYRGVLSRIRGKQADLEDSGWKVMVAWDTSSATSNMGIEVPHHHDFPP